MCECDMAIYLKYMEELRSPRVSRLADVAGETRVLRVQNAEFFEVILHFGVPLVLPELDGQTVECASAGRD